MRAVLFAILAVAACDRGHPREGAPATSAPPLPAPATPAAAACSIAPIPLRFPAPKRLVAIGDLHGDLAATRSALRAAGAIDDKDQWIGGDLVIVQTGDVLDRGDDEQAIFDLLFALEAQAKASGGAVHLLIGNHELMNAAGDFRYVTRGGAHDFGDHRVAALAPGGVYAKKIAQHNVVAIVGDTVFAHGGVVGDFATQVDEVNRSARCWLDGQAGGADAQPPVVASDESPVWTRAAGMPTADCAMLAASMKTLGVKRMVVGHTVQETGINALCDDTVWRIDVGLAKLYGGPIEVLELTEGAPPKILRGAR
jgi:calcineurin-like phosphoesterase family protein